MQHVYPITVAAFEPRIPRVVTGCHGGTVRVWDRASGVLLNDIRGNSGEIVALAFSPDGRTLLTASHDATARFWVVESGLQLGPSLSHTDAVHSAAFDADGQSVATGTRDGLVRRWEVPSPPMSEGAAQVRLRVEAQTGLKFDDGPYPSLVPTALIPRGPSS